MKKILNSSNYGIVISYKNIDKITETDRLIKEILNKLPTSSGYCISSGYRELEYYFKSLEDMNLLIEKFKNKRKKLRGIKISHLYYK